MAETVYTIGHSNHPLDRFIAILKQHAIDTLCDVRSDPYSRVNPQFNRETLKTTLNKHGINYVFLGKELGARSEDPLCYVHGKVQYDRLSRTALFQRGVDSLLKMTHEHGCALMCAEKDPLDCHRTILVARYLDKLGVPVTHILFDGTLETHRQAEVRLLRQQNIPESDDLFRSRETTIDDAYRTQGNRIAYTLRSTNDGVRHTGKNSR